jgi:hypothetical protein
LNHRSGGIWGQTQACPQHPGSGDGGSDEEFFVLARLVDGAPGFAEQESFEDELLYNRLYSLMWEGGHRWVDARRFNRLATLPKSKAGNVIYPYIPLPADECLPRNDPPASCATPAGL